MNRQERWDRLSAAMEKDIPGFQVSYKDTSAYQKLLGKVSVWNDYMSFTTTLYPKVWFVNAEYVITNTPWKTLEHEWVHLKDATTFFGLLPFLPARLNAVLWNFAYLLPQPLALLAILGFFVSPWFFLCLLFLAPIPAPFRAWSELRAYRRSVELSSDGREAAEWYVSYFTASDYYWMWPFKDRVMRSLLLESPYKAQMDAVYGE